MAALLALLAAVGWGSSDFAAGHASRRSSAISVVVLTHFTAVVVLLAVAIDLGPVWTMVVEFVGDPAAEPTVAAPRIAGRPTRLDMAWGLAAGLGGGFGAMLLFRGLGKGRMAVVAPITAAGAAIIPVVYGLATGESLTPYGLTGIGLALVAIVLVSLTGDDAGDTAADDADADAGDVDGDDSDHACEEGLARQTGDAEGAPTTGSRTPPSGDRGPGDRGLLTVPESWLETYGPQPVAAGFATTADGLLIPIASNRVAVGPVPSPSGWSTSARVAVLLADSIDPPGMSAGVAASPDVGTTVRGLLRVMRTLFLALIVGAIGIACITIADVITSDRMTMAQGAILGVSLVTIAVATASLRVARPLFRFGAAVAPAKTFEMGPAQSRWRRTLAQPGLVEALLSGVGFGAFFVFIYRTNEAAGQWPLIGARGISVVMFAIGALVTRTALVPERRGRRAVVVAGLLDAAAAVLFVLATRAGLLSIGAVLASLYPAVTVLLARTVGKEPVGRRQVAGLVLALAAIGLLAI